MRKTLGWVAALTLATVASFGAVAAQATPQEETGSGVSQQKALQPEKVEGGQTALAPGTAHGGRALYCGVQGLRDLTFPLGGLQPGNGAVLSVAEAAGDTEFIGAAVITIHNIAVQNHGVLFKVNVQWDRPLCIWVKYVEVLTN